MINQQAQVELDKQVSSENIKKYVTLTDKLDNEVGSIIF